MTNLNGAYIGEGAGLLMVRILDYIAHTVEKVLVRVLDLSTWCIQWRCCSLDGNL